MLWQAKTEEAAKEAAKEAAHGRGSRHEHSISGAAVPSLL